MSVLLVGSPNSGKTTLFNRLTGLSAKTVNYPGSTVDLLVGPCSLGADSVSSVSVIDTPGIYSLSPRSPDEAITLAALGQKDVEAVVIVLDATQLSRQLAIPVQFRKLLANIANTGATLPVACAVSMLDLLQKEGEVADLSHLERELGFPVVAIDESKDSVQKLKSLLANLLSLRSKSLHIQAPRETVSFQAPGSIAEDLREAKRIKDLVISKLEPAATSGTRDLVTPRARTRKIDSLALHPLFGPLLFFLIMAGLFSMVFWAAQPLMEIVDSSFSGLSEWILARDWLDPNAVYVRLLTDGIIAGIGAVIIFVPQIFILFAGLILLEDSGYLARAATIVDRPLKFFGLGGRSFVPLLSGFACAVPAMLAARTINSRRERLIALFVIPLMSCSARLPVYALFLAFLWGDRALLAGFVLAGIYVLSIYTSLLAAWGFHTWLKVRDREKEPESSFLILELPLYRAPKPRLALRQAWMRTKSYLARTGPVILLLSVLIWTGTTFPHFRTQDPVDRLENSYAGQMGKYLTPVFEPMGGDWRTGLGLISAFAAREVFVSTMAVLFHVTAEDDEGIQAGLIAEMRGAKTHEGGPLFTFASVFGLIIFFGIALQCLSTVAVSMKEAGSTSFALWQLLLFNLVAYGASVLTVQALRACGIS